SRVGSGFGAVALAGLLNQQKLLAQTSPTTPDPRHPLAPRPSHFPAPVRSVVWLFMNGGPRQVDTVDYKPELDRRHGQELAGFDRNTGFFRDQVGRIMRSPFRFQRHGQCGAWASELFPNMARHVDKMAFIHSCWTDSNNHAPALLKVNSG